MNVLNQNQTQLTRFEAGQLEQQSAHSWGPQWVETHTFLIHMVFLFLLNPSCIHTTFPARDYYANKILLF